MGNKPDRETDRGNEAHVGCIAVQSFLVDHTHMLRADDLPALQGLSERQFQRCRTRQPPRSSAGAGMSAAAVGTFCFEDRLGGGVRSVMPFPQVPALESVGFARLVL